MRGRNFAYLLAYMLAAGLGTLSVIWLLDKIARTEEADWRLLRVGVVAAAALLVLIVSLTLRRRRAKR